MKFPLSKNDEQLLREFIERVIEENQDRGRLVEKAINALYRALLNFYKWKLYETFTLEPSSLQEEHRAHWFKEITREMGSLERVLRNGKFDHVKIFSEAKSDVLSSADISQREAFSELAADLNLSKIPSLDVSEFWDTIQARVDGKKDFDQAFSVWFDWSRGRSAVRSKTTIPPPMKNKRASQSRKKK